MIRRQLGGDAKRRVDTAVERAVKAGYEPVDGPRSARRRVPAVVRPDRGHLRRDRTGSEAPGASPRSRSSWECHAVSRRPMWGPTMSTAVGSPRRRRRGAVLLEREPGMEVRVTRADPTLIVPPGHEEVVSWDHRPPGRQLEMGQSVAGNTDVAKAAVPEREAEDHVAAAEREGLVKAFHGLEVTPPHSDTGRGHREHVAIPRGGTDQVEPTVAAGRRRDARQSRSGPG